MRLYGPRLHAAGKVSLFRVEGVVLKEIHPHYSYQSISSFAHYRIAPVPFRSQHEL